MGKFFEAGGKTSNETSVEKVAQIPRVHFFRGLAKGLQKSVTPKSWSKAYQKAKKSTQKKFPKATANVKKTIAFVDDPAKLLTKNKKSPYYVKPFGKGKVLPGAKRKLMYVGGKVLGSPVRHPVLAAGGVYAWNVRHEGQKDLRYKEKAYNTSRMDSTALRSQEGNIYNDYFMNPDLDEYNRVSGQKLTKEQLNQGMVSTNRVYGSVNSPSSTLNYTQLNPASPHGFNFSIADSLIGQKNQIYSGNFNKVDSALMSRYYGDDWKDAPSKAEEVYNEIKYKKKKK